MGNPITSIKDLMTKSSAKARNAAWEKDLKKQMNRINLMTDMDMERQKLKDFIYSERSVLAYENQTKIEADAHRKRIDHAFGCLMILDSTQRSIDLIEDDNELYNTAKNVAKSVRALEKCTGCSADFGSERLGTLLRAIRQDEEERNAELENVIPQLLQSEDFSLLTERIVKGETVESILKTEEALSIEGQAQAVMYAGTSPMGSGYSATSMSEDVKKKLDQYKKLK